MINTTPTTLDPNGHIPTPSLLQAVDLTKTVQTAEQILTIVSGISLEIKQGENVAIMGESGSGKSTLLSLLAGLDSPSTGTIILDGIEISALNEEQKSAQRSRLLGFVFQSFYLIDSLTALDNVRLPLELLGINNAKSKALEWLDKVGLSHRTKHYPHQLSGGEQQRVAIARAFVTAPKIVFADEPTGNLDSRTGQHIIELLLSINQQQGTTLVLVTHDQTLAERCQRIYRLQNGVLV